MYAFLERTLGPTTLGLYQSKKNQDPNEILQLEAMGENPINFTSFIIILVIGVDPTKKNTFFQDTAIRNLE